MKPFDIAHTPLAGVNLIEASAGTGKTYAIEGLFLRLILEKHVPIEKILVVTFTKAATAELITRIHRKLFNALEAFRRGASEDPLIDALVKKTNPAVLSVQLLQDALTNFDRASIFTIHGFCQRILHENAFETGNLFDTELISDQTHILQEIADDFWRQHFYRADPEFLNYVLKSITGPAYFLNLLKTIRSAKIKIVPEIDEPVLGTLPSYRLELQHLRDEWREGKGRVIEKMKDSALDSRIYGSRELIAGSRLSKRERTLSELAGQLNDFLDPANIGFPLFKEFVKFTAQKLQTSARKGMTPPSDHFFDRCETLHTLAEALQRELEVKLIYLKKAVLTDAGAELTRRKRDRNVVFFDDLLVVLREAIKTAAGNTLVEEVRAKYAAALVDEFQDTDALQYDIFSKIFDSRDHVLFMIGDPKQAIYGFRGADIFSYLTASRDAQNRYTLLKNWRTGPLLNRAVNTIFSNIASPFVFEEISFSKGEAAVSAASDSDLDSQALQLWFVSRPDGKALSKADAVEIISDQVANEIVRILSDKPSRYREEDIAVLVRTNRQAQLMKEKLSEKQIPAVLYHSGNVFETKQAVELRRILVSMADPKDKKKLKAALATGVMGFGAGMINAMTDDAAFWDKYSASNQQYFLLWRSRGFMVMFRSFLQTEQVGKRLLSLPDGERSMTNLLHLAELLHRRSVEKETGMIGLIRWLEEQMSMPVPGPETHQLRLETDARAISIVTIHKSKGLEYPIVFCPFSWEGSEVRKDSIIFHDPADRYLTLDLQPDKKGPNSCRAQIELLAENVRLLYVALTRAKYRCYLVWGLFKNTSTSAMAYLFHRPPIAEGVDMMEALRQAMSGKSLGELYAEMKALEDKSEKSIQIIKKTSSEPSAAYHPPAVSYSPRSCREFTGSIDNTWQVKSYSSIVSRALQAADVPDRDALIDPVISSAGYQNENDGRAGQAESRDILLFPKGVRAGNFFHDIFEHIDYRPENSAAALKLVENKLQAHGFSPTWYKAVCQMISYVVDTPLSGSDGSMRLSALEPHERINEMAFYFPLRLLSPGLLQEAYQGLDETEVPAVLPEKIGRLNFSPARGFMKGYIDLVFRYKERYYIVDWKSNYLGPRIEDYHRRYLHHVMQESLYVLQYQIYALAVDRYLTLRVPGYRYDNHFGGVFYIFCRGFSHKYNPDFGIYADRPSIDLIKRLGHTLIPDY